MNFDDVTAIQIPEGNVKSIAIGGVTVWEAPVVDKYTWDAVFASIDAGTYATDYAIGDLVPLDLGTEGVINMQIAAFDTDNLADGSGKAPITWISKELLKTSHRMNPNIVSNDDGTKQEGTGSIGGWEKSEMRAYLIDTVKPLIPDPVAPAIKSVTKTQTAYDTTGTAFSQTTTDEVWLPDTNEVFDRSCLYKTLFTNDKSRLKYKVGAANAANWWIRSGVSISNFYEIGANGYRGIYTSSRYAQGVALGFCT